MHGSREGGTGDPARDDRPLLYHSWLKELHRVVQRSCFFLARDQRSLRLLEAGASRRMLSSQITDELKLVVHPVGYRYSKKSACPRDTQRVSQEGEKALKN